MTTLIIPSYAGGESIERTIASCAGVCDETIIISTALFPEDIEHFRRIANKVVELPWNYVFLNGHGDLYNQATKFAVNDWLLLFGVGETIAEQFGDFKESIVRSRRQKVFRCNHENDPNTWKRVWNRNGGTAWSGIIHEEIVGGEDGGLLFRMQDTEKVPFADARKNQILKFMKVVSYNYLYRKLRLDNSLLGGTNRGWLDFVNGSAEYNEQFCRDHWDFIAAAESGDLKAFFDAADKRISAGLSAKGCNFAPQGS